MVFGQFGGHIGGWTMWLFWPAILVVVAYVVYRLAVPSRGDRSRNPSQTPETILKHRYASGEIGKEEYERRLADLRR